MNDGRPRQGPGLPERPAPDPAGPPLRVLVVEDDGDTAASTAVLLGVYGYEVRLAADGPAAVEAARAHPPDVVLLDLGLPGMDGFKVAGHLRAPAGRIRPFLIAVTGHGTEADRARSREAGIDLHLLKPVDPDALIGVLRRFQAVVLPEHGRAE